MMYTSVKEPGSVKLVRYSGDDKVVVDSARVSYSNSSSMNRRIEEDNRECDDRDVRLISYLAREKHMSPFEHCHITFWVEAPIYIARQHMRHRTWSYNEVSRRYTSEELRIYEPTGYREQAPKNRQASVDGDKDPTVYSVKGTYLIHDTPATKVVSDTNKRLVDTYYALLESGVCREQARGILPQSLMTQYYATVSLRNLASFIRERCSRDAQYEIRYIANQMKEHLKSIYPLAYKALMGETDE